MSQRQKTRQGSEPGTSSGPTKRKLPMSELEVSRGTSGQNQCQSVPGTSKSLSKQKLHNDCYLYCEPCNMLYEGICLQHQPYKFNYIPEVNDKDYGELPVGIKIEKIDSSSLKVVAEKCFQKSFVFGPYKGTIYGSKVKGVKLRKDGGYAWEIYEGDEIFYYVDAKSEEKNNFLRYINLSSDPDKRNLEVFQHKKSIYYHVIKDIKPGDELLVWYGDHYAERLSERNSLYPKTSDGCKKMFYRCCEVLFEEEKKWLRHVRLYHRKFTPDEYDYFCGICDNFGCNEAVPFKEHQLKHSEERPFECELCPKKYKSKPDLSNHIATVHSDEPCGPCPLCGKSFKSSKYLKQHMNCQHHQNKSFLCHICVKGFGSMSMLNKHQKTCKK